MGAPGASLACLLLPAGPRGFCKPPMWLLGAHFLSPPYTSVSHFLNFFFFLSFFFFPIRRKSFLHNDDLCLPLQISFLKCFKDLQNYFLLEY